jgi:hypothetical protein
MFQSGVMALVQEIESHCLGKAIVTFLCQEDQVVVYELQRENESIRYRNSDRVQFIIHLLRGSNPFGSIVLRSFTSQKDELTQLPIKELRGYFLEGNGTDLSFEKLSPEAMFACQNTDVKTGEPLPLEQGVKYC